MADNNHWYLVPQPTRHILTDDKIYQRCTANLSNGFLDFRGYFRVICLWGGEARFIQEEHVTGQLFRAWRKNNPAALFDFRQRAIKAGYWDPITNDLRRTIFYYGQYFQRVSLYQAVEVFSHNPQPEHAKKAHTLPFAEKWPASRELWTATGGLGLGRNLETTKSGIDDRPLFDDVHANISRYFEGTIDGDQALSAVCETYRSFPDAVKVLREKLNSPGRIDALISLPSSPAASAERGQISSLSVQTLIFDGKAIMAHPAVLNLIAGFIRKHILGNDYVLRSGRKLELDHIIGFLHFGNLLCHDMAMRNSSSRLEVFNLLRTPGVETMEQRNSQDDIDRAAVITEWIHGRSVEWLASNRPEEDVIKDRIMLLRLTRATATQIR
ncbi:hypothetical protein BDP55DRAFT_712935 [Colletotrichum godetiae]|uniref:Uncharacterized protein n=1 Tax=Colletotrichum godetiae TaxID=1209918 RepID=A0AAJ0ARU0_9PEZI|nr:uncharacterized protein BDP55DRAFT_712935 [Colletotrichum godetiae]KAK1689205.1 hypothetical protein BDP55DRAFT_712935 [Colletotrichum godetiae]